MIRLLIYSIGRLYRGNPVGQLISGIIGIPLGAGVAFLAYAGSGHYIYPYWILLGLVVSIASIVLLIRGIIRLATGQKGPAVAAPKAAYTGPAQYPNQPYAQPGQYPSQYPQQSYPQQGYAQQQPQYPQYPQPGGSQQGYAQPQYPQQGYAQPGQYQQYPQQGQNPAQYPPQGQYPQYPQ